MPNWTAWRFKVRRSRRLQLLLLLAFLLVAWTVNSLIASALRDEPQRVAGNQTVPVAGGRVNVTTTAPVWRVGDFWVWEDDWGLRIVDRVVGTSTTSSGVGLYHVERESSMSDGRKPRVENVTYDARFLAVRSVTYADLLTVSWLQRTYGLVDVQVGGVQSNATLDFVRGEDGRVLRAINVTVSQPASYRAPAGTFRTTFVQGRIVDYDLRAPDNTQILLFGHWWSPEVANDVAFLLPNSTAAEPRVLRLVGYRSVGGHLAPPPDDPTPSWRENFTWTYEGPGGATRTFRVVEAGRGEIVVARTTTLPDGRTERDQMVHRASDLALTSWTYFGVPFNVTPHHAPLVPPDGESVWPYVKTVTAGWGTNNYTGNATARVQGGVVLETRAGTFDAVRIDLTERETGPDGKSVGSHKVRFYSDEVGNDVVFYEGDVKWQLVSYSFGIPPFRWDTLPPPQPVRR